ncbi:hypothetical protein ILP92_12970 [Maribius pontilimi]|uniref:Tetratricopeptide repeat-containing protein n=1 Tax=Palleronia pontilimi TaxID=1964209 RepID=A0A934IIH8_9RHOB|nr:hypothetical protein [Palleronia pontilimi]MBJ3763662.1 hypothetical protein [Palleronia pontilimi]
MKRIFAVTILLALAACENVGLNETSAYSDSPATTRDTASVNFYPNDTSLVPAKLQFREGNYGKSYKLYKDALEVVPDDALALLGFAASADMLRRFDQSDAAYRRLQPVIGNRPEYLNNYGYSKLLRGDLVAARALFLRAYEIDPANAVTANNLELLRNSVNSPKRAPGDLRGI